jgi:hypothetical protein
MPFGISGRGRAPGEGEVVDGKGRTLDTEQLDDVLSIHDVEWSAYDVRFTFERDGKLYEDKLVLVQ